MSPHQPLNPDSQPISHQANAPTPMKTAECQRDGEADQLLNLGIAQLGERFRDGSEHEFPPAGSKVWTRRFRALPGPPQWSTRARSQRTPEPASAACAGRADPYTAPAFRGCSRKPEQPPMEWFECRTSTLTFAASQRDCRCLLPLRGGVPDAHGPDQGRHDAGRPEALGRALRRDGSGGEVSGGAAANTIAGLASLGGNGAYIGKVGNDQLGGIFRHDIRATGVHFETPSVTSATPTARSMIFVTPDAERTMNTYLGACVELTPDDVDPEVIQHSNGHLSRRLSLGSAAGRSRRS